LVLNQLINPIRNRLGGAQQLFERPVCRIPLGHILGAGMVDQAFGQAGGEADVAFGDSDEIVAQGVKPKFCARRFGDGRVDVVDVVIVAGFGFAVRKHPVGLIVLFAPFKNIGQVSGDR